MKSPRRDAHEQLHDHLSDDCFYEEDLLDDCWGDALNKGIKSFWESIDEEEID